MFLKEKIKKNTTRKKDLGAGSGLDYHGWC